MKTHVTKFLFFICLLFIACDDEKKEVPQSKETIAVTIKNTETHNQDFGLMGIEDHATIIIAPLHSEVSTVSRNTDNHLIYSYKPTAGFKGKEKVQIEICRSPGDASCYATELTTINFTIID
jgi:hypothetical protein